mmetsp:Transcript_41161/g.86159  ORF Transcript_41161/g.86159 Transcript_41161/m.86159 type:complete len:317 (-) Transcript_41161:565-1515(-)
MPTLCAALGFDALKRLTVKRDGLRPGVLVDPAHHSLELLAWAGLYVLAAAQGEQVLRTLLPLDGLKHLPLEQLLDLLNAAVRLARDVRVDLDGGHSDLSLGEGLRERLGGLGHVGRVEGAGDGEHLGLLGALLDHNVAERLEHRLVAGAGAALREHVVGDVRLLARANLGRSCVERLLQDGVRGARDGGHRARVGLGRSVHGLSARLDQLEAVFERERARKDERRVLAEREARRHLDLLQHLGRVLLRLLHGSQRHGEDGRLGVESGVELLLRALRAEAYHVVAHDLGGEVEECLDVLVLEQLGGHADLLRALAWK